MKTKSDEDILKEKIDELSQHNGSYQSFKHMDKEFKESVLEAMQEARADERLRMQSQPQVMKEKYLELHSILEKFGIGDITHEEAHKQILLLLSNNEVQQMRMQSQPQITEQDIAKLAEQNSFEQYGKPSPENINERIAYHNFYVGFKKASSLLSNSGEQSGKWISVETKLKWKIAIPSDDSDIRKTWLKSYFGGNGDPYIEIVYEDISGLKHSVSVRIAISGGRAPSEVKLAVAELARVMENMGLNEHPDD